MSSSYTLYFRLSLPTPVCKVSSPPWRHLLRPSHPPWFCLNKSVWWPVPVAAPSTSWVCGLSPAEIVSSKPAIGLDVCLLLLLRFLRSRSLRQADQSSRGVLPTVVRHCVWSRNLKNEEDLASVGPRHHGEITVLGDCINCGVSLIILFSPAKVYFSIILSLTSSFVHARPMLSS
jgi:hypothetical protein